jgi:hypothetical protein
LASTSSAEARVGDLVDSSGGLIRDARKTILTQAI